MTAAGSSPSPAGARIETLHHASLDFDVLDAGPLDGQAVVLLHGFPERAAHWEAVSRRLHEHGLRTLAPDQRGYSPGARPRGRWSYRLSNLVGDVVALVQRYGDRVHLVGHDWGAAVAWATAAGRPDLVRSLTTVSVPHPAAYARSLLTSTQAFRSWYVLAVQPPAAVELIARTRPAVLLKMLGKAGMSAEEVEAFRREILDYGALPGALGWYRAIPFSSPFDHLRPVRVPTTHIWSDRDPTLARRGAELTGAHVDAPYELRMLHGVSHWVPTRAPERLAEIILDRAGSS